MIKKNIWPLRDAKNRFSQVAKAAVLYGPQRVTKNGKDSVVILSAKDYEQLQKPEIELVSFFKKSPLAGSGIDVTRSQDRGRSAEL
jgi:prevent-host-death family protein